MGSKGSKGAQGIQGLRGEQGTQGPAGSPGSAGLPGKQGTRGPAGSPGPAGQPGKQGDKGADGPAGKSSCDPGFWKNSSGECRPCGGLYADANTSYLVYSKPPIEGDECGYSQCKTQGYPGNRYNYCQAKYDGIPSSGEMPYYSDYYCASQATTNDRNEQSAPPDVCKALSTVATGNPPPPKFICDYNETNLRNSTPVGSCAMLLDANNTQVDKWAEATQLRIPPLYYSPGDNKDGRVLVTPKNLGEIANSSNNILGSTSMKNLYNSDNIDVPPCGCYDIGS